MSLAVALLLHSSNAAQLKSSAKANNKELAEEYLRMVYAQVGQDYKPKTLAQTDSDRRRRRVISKEEFKDYHNIYPPAEGYVAQLRGEPWPCSAAEPCAEGEGTCFNPYETYEHPDLYCEDGLWCQERKGGSRNGPGEWVEGVEFTGALKMHHMGANDLCFDPDWEYKPEMRRAVLRRKLVPCTHDNPCGPGEGDCANDNANCNDGLHCAFRADEQVGAGEPLHGIEFTADLLQTDSGANDLCYNPHWPQSPEDADYEGKVVQTCDHSGNPVNEHIVYLVLDGERHQIPNDGTFDHLWGNRDIIICKPEDAFHDIPVSGEMCPSTPVIHGKGGDQSYLMVRGKRRLIMDSCTHDHLQLADGVSQEVPQCALDAIPEGVAIKYGDCGDEVKGPVVVDDDDEVKGPVVVDDDDEVKGPVTPTHEWRVLYDNNVAGESKELMDQRWHDANSCIIKRECGDCKIKEMYYHRKNNCAGFPAYDQMIHTWASAGNKHHDDFEIYGSMEDLQAGRNPYPFCNFDDHHWEIGFPRDCGPSGKYDWNWISLKHPSSPKNWKFLAYTNSNGSGTTQPVTSEWVNLYNNQAENQSKASMDEAWRNANSCIIRRMCDDCKIKEMYYHRKNDCAGFPAYDQMIDTWKSAGNKLHDDFEIYGSMEDLQAGRNAYPFCNFDDFHWKIGFPRDCGPSGKFDWNWISLKQPSSPKNWRFEAYTNSQ